MTFHSDIDIDLKNRDEVLKFIKHIPASRIDQNAIEKHNSGIYVQEIPIDPITGYSSIDYKSAEDYGYIKLDLLNINVYEKIKDENHLIKLMNQEPNWDLLSYKEITDELFQLREHFDIIYQKKPKSIEQLAICLALIRPGKRHLIDQTWENIEKEIWKKTEDYSFKRSHSLAYATLIIVQLNLLSEV